MLRRSRCPWLMKQKTKKIKKNKNKNKKKTTPDDFRNSEQIPSFMVKNKFLHYIISSFPSTQRSLKPLGSLFTHDPTFYYSFLIYYFLFFTCCCEKLVADQQLPKLGRQVAQAAAARGQDKEQHLERVVVPEEKKAVMVAMP
jgi:hypothetical protein